MTAIDLAAIDPRAGGPAGIVAIWRGVWEVPDTGFYDLALASQGPSSWTIDDTLANQAASFDGGPTTRTVHLAAGFHAIAIAYEVDALAPRLFVAAARAGRRPQPLAPERLKPRPARNPRARAIAQVLHWLLGCLAVALAVWAIRISVPAWTAYRPNSSQGAASHREHRTAVAGMARPGHGRDAAGRHSLGTACCCGSTRSPAVMAPSPRRHGSPQCKGDRLRRRRRSDPRRSPGSRSRSIRIATARSRATGAIRIRTSRRREP